MLGYFIKYVGSSSYNAPAVLNMMAHMQYEQGVWYVKGGLHKLAEGIAQLARDIGVKISYWSGYKNCCYQNEKEIQHIVLEDGSKVSADYIVSNMEVLPFYRRILDTPPRNLTSLENKFEPASSGLVLHLARRPYVSTTQSSQFLLFQKFKKEL
ncbi:phytoene desaturase family protein [Salinicoccus sesuvii]|uniref:4,4'-diaponeurosporene oxygenase n=1 Tax=Salinicoccus sesuvii TaxID=868281 RepID=A0ABV7N9S5_9STAP